MSVICEGEWVNEGVVVRDRCHDGQDRDSYKARGQREHAELIREASGSKVDGMAILTM